MGDTEPSGAETTPPPQTPLPLPTLFLPHPPIPPPPLPESRKRDSGSTRPDTSESTVSRPEPSGAETAPPVQTSPPPSPPSSPPVAEPRFNPGSLFSRCLNIPKGIIKKSRLLVAKIVLLFQGLRDSGSRCRNIFKRAISRPELSRAKIMAPFQGLHGSGSTRPNKGKSTAGRPEPSVAKTTPLFQTSPPLPQSRLSSLGSTCLIIYKGLISNGKTLARLKLVITVLILALFVAYSILGTGYLKQRQRHEVLNSQITDVTQALAQTPESPQELEERLAEAQASLAAERSKFPGKQNSTEVINSILKLAEDCQLKTSLIAQPWSKANVGEHGYYVFWLSLTVEGSLSQFISFVSELENGEFKTLIVEDLSVRRGTEQPAAGGDISVTASLDMVIYARPAISD